MIPHDDFTPHGYLDNPYHSWKLNPSGVLRSLAPLGMGWHVPNLGTYVRNQFQYTAHLTIGLKIGQQVMVTQEDFQRHGCSITSQLHTRHRFEYTCLIPQYGLTLEIGTMGYTVSLAEIALAEAEHRADDEAFWERTPQLSGDWPAHWRRGWVYDQETVRMTIRPPVGVIGSFWDGMQIQAPRTVLAEAAMDVLFLSYADPSLAAEVILGHFESSPHPQLPCMREDGSYNMVADDGQLCGTAPEWGFPLWCCDQIFKRTGDMHWLRQLYPKAAAYLRWWLRYRTDAEGWLVYACSWESDSQKSASCKMASNSGNLSLASQSNS